jgi:AraC-like DNA-binding protein
LRCEKAQELLLATDLSIGDVAAAVGYETPQAFARMFRAEVGASPSDWRRERRA